MSKDVNDSNGHKHGNILITETAKILSSFIRKTDILARIGGDEFCAVLPNTELAIANKRKKELKERIKVCNSQNAIIKINIAIGIASTQEDESTDVYGVIKKSNERMYINKKLLKSKRKN